MKIVINVEKNEVEAVEFCTDGEAEVIREMVECAGIEAVYPYPVPPKVEWLSIVCEATWQDDEISGYKIPTMLHIASVKFEFATCDYDTDV